MYEGGLVADSESKVYRTRRAETNKHKLASSCKLGRRNLDNEEPLQSGNVDCFPDGIPSAYVRVVSLVVASHPSLGSSISDAR